MIKELEQEYLYWNSKGRNLMISLAQYNSCKHQDKKLMETKHISDSLIKLEKINPKEICKGTGMLVSKTVDMLLEELYNREYPPCLKVTEEISLTLENKEIEKEIEKEAEEFVSKLLKKEQYVVICKEDDIEMARFTVNKSFPITEAIDMALHIIGNGYANHFIVRNI